MAHKYVIRFLVIVFTLSIISYATIMWVSFYGVGCFKPLVDVVRVFIEWYWSFFIPIRGEMDEQTHGPKGEGFIPYLRFAAFMYLPAFILVLVVYFLCYYAIMAFKAVYTGKNKATKVVHLKENDENYTPLL